jgi:hypothetical protein
MCLSLIDGAENSENRKAEIPKVPSWMTQWVSNQRKLRWSRKVHLL